MSVTGISFQEFKLWQRFIREYCGIEIYEDKRYFLESRLARLLPECGARNFLELYYQLSDPQKRQLVLGKVLDAVTINETSWFRDKTPWQVLAEILLPVFIRELQHGERKKVRIWHAACSTGQEAYSTLICIDNYLNRTPFPGVSLQDFEILATDVSPAALAVAKEGRYDGVTMARGMDDSLRAKYFNRLEQAWVIDNRLRRAIKYELFNLLDSFDVLGNFDVIFCRYVTVYFLEKLKTYVLDRMSAALNSGGVLFLGNSEIFSGYKDHFELQRTANAIYYKKLSLS